MKPAGGKEQDTPQHPRTLAAVIEAVGIIKQPRFQLPTIELQIALNEKQQEICERARHRNWPSVDRLLPEFKTWIDEQRLAAEAHWARVREEAAAPDADLNIIPGRVADPPSGIAAGDYLSGRIIDTEVTEEEARNADVRR